MNNSIVSHIFIFSFCIWKRAKPTENKPEKSPGHCLHSKAAMVITPRGNRPQKPNPAALIISTAAYWPNQIVSWNSCYKGLDATLAV